VITPAKRIVDEWRTRIASRSIENGDETSIVEGGRPWRERMNGSASIEGDE
jgi:hypothetical protein